MMIGKALRAWLASVMTCAFVLFAFWVWAMQQPLPTPSTLSTARLEQAFTAFLVLFGVLFGFVATFVYIPTFILLDTYRARALTRTRAVLIGVSLALVPRVLMAWRIEEAASPAAWLLYWAQNFPRFPLSAFPFLIAGAVFGWVWSRPGPQTEAIHTARVRVH